MMATGRIAIVPARGGSKRIPRKNIKHFAGKPMIAYAIEAAIASRLFDHVIVSTDDAEIGEISRSCGAETPFPRPSDLADDFTPTVPVVAHAIEACRDLGWSIASACCIYPGVPFIETGDLQEGLRLLETGIAAYTFPVTGFPSPIQRALRLEDGGRIAPFDARYVNVRTQDLEPAYHDAGQFYWGRAEAWIEGLNIHANGASMVLPEWRVVDIDTSHDWDRAEALFRATRS